MRAGSTPADPRRLHRPPRPAPAAASRAPSVPAAPALRLLPEQGATAGQLFPTLAQVVRREQEQLEAQAGAAATQARFGSVPKEPPPAPPLQQAQPPEEQDQPPPQQGEAWCRPHPIDPAGVVFEWRVRGVEAAVDPLESPAFMVGGAQVRSQHLMWRVCGFAGEDPLAWPADMAHAVKPTPALLPCVVVAPGATPPWAQRPWAPAVALPVGSAAAPDERQQRRQPLCHAAGAGWAGGGAVGAAPAVLAIPAGPA